MTSPLVREFRPHLLGGADPLHRPEAPERHARVGCSGWTYAAWQGAFYPATLPPGEWLEHYSSVFDVVEVNGTFYRLPMASTFSQWRERTPDGFLMALKASRYLTHLKCLRESEEPTDRLLSRARNLRDRLGPILYQLPPHLTRDLPRLDRFLAKLPRHLTGVSAPLRHVLEFRHPSWYVQETFDVLEWYGVSLCMHDKLGSGYRDGPVGPVAYVRFHGTSGHYAGSYDSRTLARWGARLADWWQDGFSVYAFFNNDPGAVATQNARVLRDALQARL